MSRRVWVIVVIAATTLMLSSHVMSALPMLVGLVQQVLELPLTVVVLATVSCVLWLVSLIKLYRTWVVRRSLVRVLARIGTPTSVIANRAGLSQDSVAFISATSSGKRDTPREEIFSGTGKQFIPFHALQGSCDRLVS